MYGRDALLPQDLKLQVHDNRRLIDPADTDISNYQYILTKTLQKEYTKLLANKDAEQAHYENYYDLDHIDVTYTKGDTVLVLYDTPVKSCLMPRWEGPFRVTCRLDPVTYRVEDETRITTTHVQRMKLLKKVSNTLKDNVTYEAVNKTRKRKGENSAGRKLKASESLKGGGANKEGE
jgi:hypothetical protein